MKFYPGEMNASNITVKPIQGEILSNIIRSEFKMENVRVLTGWSKEEQKELESFKDGINSAMDTIAKLYSECFKNDAILHQALLHKYGNLNNDGENQMVKDIVDYFTDDAKFPEKKYYVHLIDEWQGYLNYDYANNLYETAGKGEVDGVQTQFTEQEIKSIDPRYITFAVEVDD